MSSTNHDAGRKRSSWISEITPVVGGLMIVYVAVFVIDVLLKDTLTDAGVFSVNRSIFGGHIWQIISMQFLHAKYWHLIFNLLGLYSVGPVVERWWGSARFLWFYLICGSAAAIFMSLAVFTRILPADYPTLGASASLYGCFIAAALIAPQLRIRLAFPPIELTMRLFAFAVFVFSAALIFIDSHAGGETCHLGGALIGILLVRCPWLLGSGGAPRSTKYSSEAPS